MVPAQIVENMMPAYESGTPICACITGQAAPSSESGRPRLMKDR